MRKLKGMEVISAQDYLKEKPKKASREGNKLTEYNGVTYHSAKEAKWAQHIDWMLQANQIKSCERQVPLECKIGEYKITTYICDFVITTLDGKKIYQDVKGRKSGGPYQMFLIKKRLVKAILGIDIIEV